MVENGGDDGRRRDRSSSGVDGDPVYNTRYKKDKGQKHIGCTTFCTINTIMSNFDINYFIYEFSALLPIQYERRDFGVSPRHDAATGEFSDTGDLSRRWKNYSPRRVLS